MTARSLKACKDFKYAKITMRRYVPRASTTLYWSYYGGQFETTTYVVQSSSKASIHSSTYQSLHGIGLGDAEMKSCVATIVGRWSGNAPKRM